MTDQDARSAPTCAPDQTCSTDRKSSARAEASRRNGAKSRGPNTAEGKARSARNALKHGLRSHRFVLLADEDIAEYQALEEALRAELMPEGALQNVLFTRVAAAAWRMLRTDRIEIELLEQHVSLNARSPRGPGLALIRDGHGPRAFDTLLRYRNAVQAEFWRSLRALSALKAGDPVPVGLPAGAVLPSRARDARPAEPARIPGCLSSDRPDSTRSPHEPERRCILHDAQVRWRSDEPEQRRNLHETPRALDSKRTRNPWASAQHSQKENVRRTGLAG